jgi:N-formylglutamate amidohydrolase
VSKAYSLNRPHRQSTAAVFSSPHSGRDYAREFLARSVLDMRAIRSSEDAFVDRLFSAAPRLGAPLLAAQAPRAFIDLNRSPDELDPALIEGIGQTAHNPRISSGLGIIPRVVAGGMSIYRGKMPIAEAEARIADHWHPFHAALKGLIDETLSAFGECILIDCHSMPHEAIESHTRPGRALPDVVLGDRFGAAASADVMGQVEAAFQRADFRVARNTPFAGAYIAQTYGRPVRNVHVVQVEIDRSLYMNEATIAPRPDFGVFRARIEGVMADIASIGRARLPLAAE